MSDVICQISSAVIDPADVLRQVPDPSHGAGNVFFGYVRNINLGKKVVAIAYDAFEPLAEKLMRELCDEAREKWGPDLRVFLAHRTGMVRVGEISIAIFVGSRHRDASYQASRYIIEQIKVRAPIWKKEIYDDGETDWVRGHALCKHDDRGDHSCGGHVHPHGNG